MIRTSLAVLALALLAACTGGPRVSSSTTDAVTVEYAGDASNEAAQKAADECARYGKRARLRNVANQANTSGRLAIYDCVQ